MIQLIRIIVATVVAAGLAWFLGKTVIDGIRTGAIRHTNSTTRCQRQKNPIGFWILVVMFSGMSVIFASVWIWAIMDAIRKMR